MERETKTTTTTNGHQIVHYTYLTGREHHAIEAEYLTAVQMGVKNNEPEVKSMDNLAEHRAEKVAITLLVKSIDGKTDNVFDTAFDLKQEDYDDIVVAINAIAKKKKA